MTLTEILPWLIGLAVVAVLAVAIVTALRRAMGGAGLGTSSLPPASTRFTWVTPASFPVSFPKDTDYDFVVRLEIFAAGPQRWNPHGGQSTLAGAVQPASVSIVRLNGAAAGATTPMPAPSSGTGFTATTDPSTGLVTVTVRGTQAADARFDMVYVRTDGTVSTASATFAVTD